MQGLGSSNSLASEGGAGLDPLSRACYQASKDTANIPNGLVRSLLMAPLY